MTSQSSHEAALQRSQLPWPSCEREREQKMHLPLPHRGFRRVVTVAIGAVYQKEEGRGRGGSKRRAKRGFQLQCQTPHTSNLVTLDTSSIAGAARRTGSTRRLKSLGGRLVSACVLIELVVGGCLITGPTRRGALHDIKAAALG